MIQSVVRCTLAAALFAAIPLSAAAQDEEGNSDAPFQFDPTEIRRGMRMGGESGKSRDQLYYEQVISRVEPDLVGDADRLPVYIEYFKIALVNDLRIIPFDAEAEVEEDGTIVLTGYNAFPETGAALVKLLTHMGFENIDNRIEELPSASLGEKKYGIVTATHVITYDRPELTGEKMTNALLGDHVFLLKSAPNDTYLCQTSEGYVSYVAASAVRAVDADEFSAWMDAPKVVVRLDSEEGENRVPAGARLPFAGMSDEGEFAVRMPDGSVRNIPTEIAAMVPAGPGEQASIAMRTAQSLLGSKYVWGGKTSDGVDCSGLVQSSYRAAGINLARDAYQQAYGGEIVATRWYREHLRGGDTLYFLGRGGKITHTAMYLGNDILIEASGGTVRLSSFDPESDLYREARDRGFCFGKRIVP